MARANQRALTAEEIEAVKALHWPRHRYTARDLKMLAVPAIGAALSTPLAIVFFCAARFLHGEEIERALQIGLLGFVPGAALGVLLLVIGIVGTSKPTLPGLQQELARGTCSVRSHRAIRAWHLVDDGDEQRPDLLLDLGGDRLLMLPTGFFADAAGVRQQCTIARLPKSLAVVSVAFTGLPIPIAGSPVVTKDLWRYDDLPSFEPFRLDSAPDELRAAIERAA